MYSFDPFLASLRKVAESKGLRCRVVEAPRGWRAEIIRDDQAIKLLFFDRYDGDVLICGRNAYGICSVIELSAPFEDFEKAFRERYGG